MPGVLNVGSIEELRQFLNEKGVFEIALRGKNKKFSAFQKIALNITSQDETKEILKQAINVMNRNNALTQKSISMISNVAKLQQLSMILSGVNLCATCAGFAVMYAKLNKVSGQINQLMNIVKQENEIQIDYEFKKIISEQANMLDCRKTQKFYTEEQMRKLVDDEYNILGMLADAFMKDLTTDTDGLIFSIYSLASMLSVSIRYFDEVYYFNNKEVIGDGDVWHLAHNNWMASFERLIDSDFIKKIQDHGIFNLHLSTVENDIYYINLYDQIKSLMEDVQDNQKLIRALDSKSVLAQVTEDINIEVSNGIKSAFSQVEGAMENPDVKKVYRETMKQMALEV